MSSIKNSETSFSEHSSNINIRKTVNSNIESRNETPVKFGYCEDTNDIKKLHSTYPRMMGNGMNSMNSNSEYMNKKSMGGHINETKKYKPTPRKVIPINNKERPNSFNGFNNNKYQNMMKQTRYSPSNDKYYDQNIQVPQNFSPRRIKINSNQNRQPSSPSQFSPSQYSPRYQFNHRYPTQEIQQVQSQSIIGINIPSSVPMIQKPMNHQQYIPNTNINKASLNYKNKILKKKSSAIDIIDPETNEKKNYEKTEDKKIEIQEIKTNEKKNTKKTEENKIETQEIKSNISEIKKQEIVAQSSGTKTPVNEVIDTTNTPLEGLQIVESDSTETACETSDIEEEQNIIKTEVNEISENDKQEENIVTIEEKQEENCENKKDIENTEKIEENEEKIDELVKSNIEKVENEEIENIDEKKEIIEETKKEVVVKKEIVEEKNIEVKKVEEKDNENKNGFSFENVLYPKNIEIPTIRNGVNVYSKAFLLLFQKYCTKAPADLDCPLLPRETEKVKNKNNNSRGSKNSKNYHQGGNNNNNSFDHNNNSKSNHNQNKNMGGRSTSNNSSRRGNVGRSFSRRQQQQQQQQDLPPVAPLQKSENAWIRAKQINIEDAEEEEKREIIFRKVKGILNKLTLEKFDLLGKQIVNIGIDDEIILSGIIKLIFDKAIDEPNFGKLYAKLCSFINIELPEIQSWVKIEEKKNNVFRRLMLNRCQEEFEKNTKWSEDIEESKPVSQMTDDEKLEYSKKISERTKKKRRSLGNIRFIGELYMCQMITEKIIHICFGTLMSNLSEPDEESVECLCYLLETVGAKVENLAKLRTKNGITLKEWKEYFKQIDAISKNKELPSRMRFMLMDVIELKKNKWKSRISETGPKTIAEIHKEAERELKEQEIIRNSSRSGSGRSSSTRSMGGSRRGDSMNTRINQNELNKFGKLDININVLTPGGGSLSRFNFGAKKNTTQNRASINVVNKESPLSAHNNMFEALNDEEKTNEIVAEPVEDKTLFEEKKKPNKEMDPEKAEKRIQHTFEEYINQRDMNEAIESIKEIGTDKYNRKIVEKFISKYMDKKESEMKLASGLISKLYEEKLLTTKEIIDEIKDQAEFIEDMLFDAPEIYNFYGIFLADLIKIKAISFSDVKVVCDLMKDVREVKKTGIPPPAKLLGKTLSNLKNIIEENEFIKGWTSFNTSLKSFWYEQYDIEKMVDWVINNKLQCIYPISTNFKDLLGKIGKEPSEEILKYVHSSVDEFTQTSSEFICGLIQIALANMKNKNTEEQTEFLDGFKPIFNSFIKSESNQIEILTTIEEFYKKSEEMIVTIYQILIKQEIIDKKTLQTYIEKSCKASEETKSKLNELA